MRLAVATAIGLAVAIQAIPYGRAHTNPPGAHEAAWDSPRTRELAVRACFDCHSNRTRWPWYASIAPLSWRIQTHVDGARRKFNMTEMHRPQKDAAEAAEAVRKREMPPADYQLLHPRARLSREERAALVRGLAATFGDASATAGARD